MEEEGGEGKGEGKGEGSEGKRKEGKDESKQITFNPIIKTKKELFPKHGIYRLNIYILKNNGK